MREVSERSGTGTETRRDQQGGGEDGEHRGGRSPVLEGVSLHYLGGMGMPGPRE